MSATTDDIAVINFMRSHNDHELLTHKINAHHVLLRNNLSIATVVVNAFLRNMCVDHK